MSPVALMRQEFVFIKQTIETYLERRQLGDREVGEGDAVHRHD